MKKSALLRASALCSLLHLRKGEKEGDGSTGADGWRVASLLVLPHYGYVKGRFTGKTPIRSAVETTVVGGLAAAAAFAIAKFIA